MSLFQGLYLGRIHERQDSLEDMRKSTDSKPRKDMAGPGTINDPSPASKELGFASPHCRSDYEVLRETLSSKS